MSEENSSDFSLEKQDNFSLDFSSKKAAFFSFVFVFGIFLLGLYAVGEFAVWVISLFLLTTGH